MYNPFKFGRVVDGDHFCNRRFEVEELRNHIKSMNSVWLFSPRRYGKTSLLMHTFKNLSGVKTVYFDMYNVMNTEDFKEKYLNTLSRELVNWKSGYKGAMKILSQTLKGLRPVFTVDHMGTPTVSIESHCTKQETGISEILKLPEKLNYKEPVCIAIDEFQEVMRIDPFLINMMRSVFQHQKNVCYVFLGSKESLMEKIFSDVKSPFYQFGVRMNLNKIEYSELSNYINKKFESSGLSIKQQIINEILQLSNCHPHYTQYISSVAWDLTMQQIPQDEDFTNKCISHILAGQSEAFYNIYELLNTNQRLILYVLSKETHVSLMSEKIQRKYSLPALSTVNTAVKALIKKSLVHKKNGSYSFENPLFKLWLQKINS